MNTSEHDNIKRNDQILLLEACGKFTHTGEWNGLFTYPDCGWDLVQQGLITKDRKITDSGKAALWLLDKWPDPTASKVCESISFKLGS